MACALAGTMLAKTAANDAAKRNVHRAEFMGSPHPKWLTILREPRKFHRRPPVPRSKSEPRLQNEDCECPRYIRSNAQGLRCAGKFLEAYISTMSEAALRHSRPSDSGMVPGQMLT